MPDSMTRAAASDGRPPIASAMAMATGIVTDFGTSEAVVSGAAPSEAAMRTADATAVAEPAAMAASAGTIARRTLTMLA